MRALPGGRSIIPDRRPRVPQTAIVKPYRWLAQYYDEVFSSARFPIDVARERLLSRIMPSVGTACDLACGTGTTALILARKGITMYAVDLSPLMCRLTREKAERAGLPIRVLQADMRNFRLPNSSGPDYVRIRRT